MLLLKIRPFRSLIYNRNKVRDISSVVAPPYDIIPPKMQESLYRRHPYNIVRLILGKVKKEDDVTNNRYTRARKFFKSWLENDILVPVKAPSIFVYSQVYRDDSKVIERIGFIGLMGLDRDKKAKILPHESTLLAPKLDRLNLIRGVRANLSPIFVLYEDRAHRIADILKSYCRAKKPLIDVKFEDVSHRVWTLTDAHIIRNLEALMRSKEVFIADGHHRYEAALTYSLELKNRRVSDRLKRNSEFLMAYFVESDERMLTILPVHRLIRDMGMLKKDDITKKLKAFFHVERVSDLDELMSRMNDLHGRHLFGLYLGRGDFYILKLKDPTISDGLIKNKSQDWKRLDVAIFHLFILEYALGIRQRGLWT